MAAGTNHITPTSGMPGLVVGPPALCLISGTVFMPDGNPLKNGTVQFNSVVEQTLLGGAVVPPTLVTTTTDANGALIPISLIQGLQGQFAFGSPAAGGYGDPTPVIIPIAPTADISSIMVGIQLATGTTMTFTALSVTGDSAFAGAITVGGLATFNGTIDANGPVVLNNTFQVFGTMFFPDGSTYTTAGHNTMKALGIGTPAPTVNPNALLINNLTSPGVMLGSSETQPSAALGMGSAYNLEISAGAHDIGATWIADNTFATIINLYGANASIGLYVNGGLTVGSSFTPTEVANWNANGLAITTPSSASQLRFGSITSPSAAIQASGTTMNITAGAYGNGSQWIATGTAADLVTVSGPSSGTFFYANTGLTVGSPVPWTNIAYINTGGLTVATGSIVSPNLHITSSVQFDSGATITGTITTNTVNMNNLGVTNNATISGTATIGVCNMNSGACGGNFTVSGQANCNNIATNLIYTTTGGVYEQWTGSYWQWVSGGAARMTLDTGGNLVSGGNFTAGANIQADANIEINGGVLYMMGGLGAGYYFQRASSGHWYIVEGGVVITDFANGSAGFNGSISAASNIQSATNLLTNQGGSMAQMTQWWPNGINAGWVNAWVQGVGDWYWNNSNTNWWVLRASDAKSLNNLAAVAGNGAYINTSDIRGKQEIEPETRGLKVVQQLKPIGFKRLPKLAEREIDGKKYPFPAPRREIGFSAQDLQAVLPEAVEEIGIELPDGTGGLNSGAPSLGISESMLIPVLVNAIKELAQRVEELEGRGNLP